MAGGRLWTPEEDGYLIENYTKLGRNACADHLKRPINGVKCRAYTLGIQANVTWPEREDNLLVEMYPKIGRAGCAKLLPGRTIASIGVRAGFLGLTNDKRHAPTPNEIKVIRDNYKQRGGRKKCAELLPHLTPSAISHLAEKSGVLQRGRKDWTDEENQLLRFNYASKGKHWCAQQLSDRTPNSIVVQARKLGLATDPNSEYFKDWQARAAASKRGRPRPGASELMKKLREQGRLPQPVFTAERREKHAETMRAWHARHGNPNKGKSLSDETRRKMSVATQRRWNDPEYCAKMSTPERKQRRRQASSESWFRSGRANENAYSRCGGGRRADLGDMFFRSGWEANYARILNLQIEQGEIHRWEFEPDRFKFSVVKGPRSYTPDFKVWKQEGGDFHYVEIKGWMDEKSRLKCHLMERFYPNVPIYIIGEKEYKNLQREFSSRIERWEFYSSRYVAKRKAASVV
jgi:NUMOD3 motif